MDFNQPTPPQADGVWKTFCSRMPDSDCNPQASPQSGGEYIPYSIQTIRSPCQKSTYAKGLICDSSDSCSNTTSGSRWIDSAILSQLAPKGVYSGKMPWVHNHTTKSGVLCPARLSQINSIATNLPTASPERLPTRCAASVSLPPSATANHSLARTTRLALSLCD